VSRKWRPIVWPTGSCCWKDVVSLILVRLVEKLPVWRGLGLFVTNPAYCRYLELQHQVEFCSRKPWVLSLELWNTSTTGLIQVCVCITCVHVFVCVFISSLFTSIPLPVAVGFCVCTIHSMLPPSGSSMTDSCQTAVMSCVAQMSLTQSDGLRLTMVHVEKLNQSVIKHWAVKFWLELFVKRKKHAVYFVLLKTEMSPFLYFYGPEH